MIDCPECGNEIGDLANFCNKCGTKLPPSPLPVDPEEKAERNAKFSWNDDSFGICGEIGHVMQESIVGAKFCSACGVEFKPVAR